MASTSENPRGKARRWLGGESVLASAGLTAAAIVCGALLTSAWWTLREQGRLSAQERRHHAEAVASVLAGGLESVLSPAVPLAEEPESARASALSAARRMVSEAAVKHGLESVRLTLPNGAVVADADAKKVTAKGLPEKWEGRAQSAAKAGEGDGPSAEAAGGVGTGAPVGPITVAMTIPGRGEAELTLVPGAGPVPFATAAPGIGGLGRWEWQAGVGAIAASALAGMLVAYRMLRKRMAALLAIREALSAVGEEGRGEAGGLRGAAALALTDDLGPEARAWNRILAEREMTRQEAALEKVTEQLRGAGPSAGAEGELQTACDALPTGLLLVDDQCRIKYLNGAAAVFAGAKRDAALGKPLSAFLAEPEVTEAVVAAVQGQVRTRSVLELRRETGEAAARLKGPHDAAPERRGSKAFTGGVLKVTVRPVRREDAGAAVVTIEDVTQTKAAEEARNSFVAQATHELRTPLTNIRLYVDQLIEDQEADGGAGQGPEGAARAKAINVIAQESRRLERIVGDMLSVAEIEAGSMKLRSGDVRLATLLSELQNDYEPQAKAKGLGLRFDLSPKLPVLKGDRDKVALAVHNLLGNAIKYTPEGGRVTLKADCAGGKVTIEVIDNGLGIKEDECELIFEKFYRANDSRIAGITGSGLGLALAREVVRMHGGDITVQSSVGKGSTFTLTLPAAA
jgi:signal transduction histidine kinase